MRTITVDEVTLSTLKEWRQEQAKDFTNGVGEATTDMKDGVYNATRTATTAATSAFSNGTVWSWIIVVAVVLGIAFLIWYLVKRNHNE